MLRRCMLSSCTTVGRCDLSLVLECPHRQMVFNIDSTASSNIFFKFVILFKLKHKVY